MTEFIILEIKQINPEEISLRIKTDDLTKDYSVYFRDGLTQVADELEITMRDKDFNYHHQFGRLLSDIESGKPLSLPINLWAIS